MKHIILVLSLAVMGCGNSFEATKTSSQKETSTSASQSSTSSSSTSSSSSSPDSGSTSGSSTGSSQESSTGSSSSASIGSPTQTPITYTALPESPCAAGAICPKLTINTDPTTAKAIAAWLVPTSLTNPTYSYVLQNKLAQTSIRTVTVKSRQYFACLEDSNLDCLNSGVFGDLYTQILRKQLGNASTCTQTNYLNVLGAASTTLPAFDMLFTNTIPGTDGVNQYLCPTGWSADNVTLNAADWSKHLSASALNELTACGVQPSQITLPVCTPTMAKIPTLSSSTGLITMITNPNATAIENSPWTSIEIQTIQALLSPLNHDYVDTWASMKSTLLNGTWPVAIPSNLDSSQQSAANSIERNPACASGRVCGEVTQSTDPARAAEYESKQLVTKNQVTDLQSELSKLVNDMAYVRTFTIDEQNYYGANLEYGNLIVDQLQIPAGCSPQFISQHIVGGNLFSEQNSALYSQQMLIFSPLATLNNSAVYDIASAAQKHMPSFHMPIMVDHYSGFHNDSPQYYCPGDSQLMNVTITASDWLSSTPQAIKDGLVACNIQPIDLQLPICAPRVAVPNFPTPPDLVATCGSTFSGGVSNGWSDLAIWNSSSDGASCSEQKCRLQTVINFDNQYLSFLYGQLSTYPYAPGVPQLSPTASSVDSLAYQTSRAVTDTYQNSGVGALIIGGSYTGYISTNLAYEATQTQLQINRATLALQALSCAGN